MTVCPAVSARAYATLSHTLMPATSSAVHVESAFLASDSSRLRGLVGARLNSAHALSSGLRSRAWATRPSTSPMVATSTPRGLKWCDRTAGRVQRGLHLDAVSRARVDDDVVVPCDRVPQPTAQRLAVQRL